MRSDRSATAATELSTAEPSPRSWLDLAACREVDPEIFFCSARPKPRSVRSTRPRQSVRGVQSPPTAWIGRCTPGSATACGRNHPRRTARSADDRTPAAMTPRVPVSLRVETLGEVAVLRLARPETSAYYTLDTPPAVDPVLLVPAPSASRVMVFVTVTFSCRGGSCQ
jgi:hypothetical protein